MKTPRQVVTEFFKRVRSGLEPEAAAEFLAPKVYAHQVISSAKSTTHERSPSNYAEHVVEMLRQNGAFTLTIEEMLVDGEKVYVRWLQNGHHAASFYGETPTGADIVQRASAVYRVDNELIVEYWIQVEDQGVRVQIQEATHGVLF